MANDKARVLDGRYEITSVIGEGGMAKVFRGTDRVLGRTVAVKVLSPQFAEDQSFVARFRREAQAAAALNHPNIVSVFDTGSVGNVHYIVMEFVEGRTLKDVVREDGRLLPERAVEIGEAVSRALAAAHAKGLVHRDIKPANIMITAGGQVKVMDFGIARATSADTVTQTAAVLGTAAYLSPEQAQGETVDARSDIYSLGVVLYEMLTGQAPFTGDSPVSVAYKHVTENPPSPSRINPDVTDGLEAVVLKSMAKNPANRYQSADEIADDLRRAREGLPVAATPVLTGEATQVIDRSSRTQVLTAPFEGGMDEEPPPRRTGLIVLITLLVLAILGLAAFFLVRALTGGREPVEVPDVVGFQEEAAIGALEERGLEVEVERRVAPNFVGQVVEQDPEGGAMAREGDTVTIFVGREPAPATVPDVVGLSEEEARSAIEEAGLVVGDVDREPTEEAEPGTVLSQDPAAGREVSRNSEVDLVVAEEPATVAVPDVVCDPMDQARQEIEDAGLEYEEVGEEFSTECDPDTVARQQPQPGTRVARGETVQVWRSLGPSPEPSPTDGDAILDGD